MALLTLQARASYRFASICGCGLAIVSLAAPAVAGSAEITGGAANASHIVDVGFFSQVLGREKRFTVVLPAQDANNGAVLFFLHGRGRNHRSLVDLEKARAALLAAPFYIVLPDGEDGFYINSPVDAAARYNDYLEEVIHRAESLYPLSREKQRRAIAGWSMGGYGAVCFAETHRGEFGIVASLIGLLDFPRPEDLPAGQNYQIPTDQFGSDSTMWRKLNPWNYAESLIGSQVLVLTATKAFDRTMNERFYRQALAAGVACQFGLLEGAHTIDVVQRALPVVLRFVAQHLVSKDGAIPPIPARKSLDGRDQAELTKSLERFELKLGGYIPPYAARESEGWNSWPLPFTDVNLILNYAHSAADCIRMELQDENGVPILRRTPAAGARLIGDKTGRIASWRKNAAFGPWGGPAM